MEDDHSRKVICLQYPNFELTRTYMVWLIYKFDSELESWSNSLVLMKLF